MNSFFIVTHKKIPWDLSFEHTLIGIEGFTPDTKAGFPATETISKLLDSETAFGALRALTSVNEGIRRSPTSETVFMGTYRLFLSQETNADWLSPILQENKIISPEELSNNWRSLVATELPEGVDIMIPAPRLLPDTLLGQYSRVHHLDDLLLATGCAIRAGLLDPLSVPSMLSSNTLIPYGNFASKKALRIDFNDRLWWCVQDFYKNHYTPRIGYQRRVIDFVFERINSMSIAQMIIKKDLNCVSARNIWVSEDGKYQPSI
jgi:hypothetical protein